MKRLLFALALVTALGTATLPARADALGDAIVDNGVVQLGVHDYGDLNVHGGAPSWSGTTIVGLRYLPNNAEATADGCTCEGWGVADATTATSGYANTASGRSNLTPETFTSTPSTAVSTVLVGDGATGSLMRVTHDYHPSADTVNLYEVTVTVENVSSVPVDLRYRRVMDWDIQPSPFEEYSTIQGTAAAANVLFAGNNGFATADPLIPAGSLGFTGDFVDAGPFDHGASFDFGFGSLPAGESKTFKTFYGAAGNEADALAALTAVGAEVYSLGQPSRDFSGASADPAVGNPNTFVFGFRGVGGTPIGALPTTTTYTGPSSVQYSDSLTLSGRLEDSAGPTGIAGETLDFTLGTDSLSGGPTDATGSASAAPFQQLQVPGSYTVDTAFAERNGYAASSDSDAFTIDREDCTLSYTGDTLVTPASNTTLAADMGELDGSLGDRSGKTVTFSVSDAALVTTTYDAVTDAAGHAETSVALPSGAYGVSASFAGDAYYSGCSTAIDTVVTVQAADAKVTGGGWISASGRTSFGFNVIPEAGDAAKGQLQLRSANGKNRFHGPTAAGLTCGPPNACSWSGTGRWNSEAGSTFTIWVIDNGSSGAKKGDMIKIEIRDSSNALVYSTGGYQVLRGGNIKVH